MCLQNRQNGEETANPHRFPDLAAEHVDPEDLGVVVALGEGEAVALRRAVVASHAEQNLVDGVVGDLRAGVGLQQPETGRDPVGALLVRKNTGGGASLT